MASSISPIFFSSRFRSGSTMLWNIFRNIEGTTVIYEPLHELLQSFIHKPVTPQKEHYFVESYFNEYETLTDALALHQRTFASDRLYLQSDEPHSDLKKYIDALIQAIPDQKLGIFKFNRIDFRLEWIKKNYPSIPLLHLSRNPRDQWYSSIGNFRQVVDNEIDFDYYFLTTWARDLYQQFPFISSPYIEHSYQRFYYLWKLSYLAGKRLADLSVAYEDLLSDPEQQLAQILRFSGLYSEKNLENGIRYILTKPERSWVRDRNDEWFMDLERKCEDVLDELGLNSHFAIKPLAEIQADSPQYQEFLSSNAAQLWAMNSLKQDIANLHVATYEIDYTNKLNSQKYDDSIQELQNKNAEQIAEADKMRLQIDRLNQDFSELTNKNIAINHALDLCVQEKVYIQDKLELEQAESARLNAEFSQSIQEKEHKQQELESKIILLRQIEADYTKILHSRSYRLTEPLRFLAGKLRIVREYLRKP